MGIFLILIFIIGGWEFLFWGFFTNVIVWNLICSVNSLSHWFGYRSYPTNTSDLSSNNFLPGLLAMGGGWHNNHHAFPSSARHGFFHWWELDITYLAILFFKRLGLVNHIKFPKLSQLKLARVG
jgi:stearoyl-CoA desaturase (delta-9 desaturase)